MRRQSCSRRRRPVAHIGALGEKGGRAELNGGTDAARPVPSFSFGGEVLGSVHGAHEHGTRARGGFYLDPLLRPSQAECAVRAGAISSPVEPGACQRPRPAAGEPCVHTWGGAAAPRPVYLARPARRIGRTQSKPTCSVEQRDRLDEMVQRFCCPTRCAPQWFVPLDTPRLMIPGDKRGARDAHDVVTIAVE